MLESLEGTHLESDGYDVVDDDVPDVEVAELGPNDSFAGMSSLDSKRGTYIYDELALFAWTVSYIVTEARKRDF